MGVAVAKRGLDVSPTEQTPNEVLRKLVQTRFLQKDWRRWKERTPDITAALRALNKDQARTLADELWGQYDHESIMYFMGQINASVPGTLTEWCETFLDQGHLRPGWLFLGAPPAATKRLLGLLADPAPGQRPNDLLLALAWIGDDLVQKQFRAWRDDPPLWSSQLYIAPHEYAKEAGWELTPGGDRRNLYLPTCYELTSLDESERTPSRRPVVSPTPTETACGWCGRDLVTLLDINLSDPRCALIIEGIVSADAVATRLRIAHCLWCSCYATLYTDVDRQGAVRWSDANEKMPRILERVGLGSDYELLPSAAGRLVLGRRRRTSFEAMGRFMLAEGGVSQIGGHPEWIQDAEYPVCPGCQRLMTCIGQVAWEDVEAFAEGITYSFVCLDCGKAATTYQQT